MLICVQLSGSFYSFGTSWFSCVLNIYYFFFKLRLLRFSHLFFELCLSVTIVCCVVGFVKKTVMKLRLIDHLRCHYVWIAWQLRSIFDTITSKIWKHWHWRISSLCSKSFNEWRLLFKWYFRCSFTSFTFFYYTTCCHL